MSRIVVDASAIIPLYFAEEHSEAAEYLVREANRLLAPDLIWAEMANVVWKRRRRGEISGEDTEGIIAEILRLPLHISSTQRLLPDAVRLATQFDRTVYDCLYVALAIRCGVTMVTGDERLCNALAGTPLGQHLRWIGAKS
jgi:predicted nucleic acid-binding protein